MIKKPSDRQLEQRVLELEECARRMETAFKSSLLQNDNLIATNRQLESAIETANQLALDGELTRIELNHIFNADADGKCIVDMQHTVLKINQTFASLFGVDKEAAVHRKCFDLIPGPECHTHRCPLARIKTGEIMVEDDVQKKSARGPMISCMLRASSFKYPTGDEYGIVLSFRDITDRKYMEEKLRELASTDSLTKTMNRRHFLELAHRELERTKRQETPLALLALDIDHFKAVNDTYGHDIGDMALVRLAEDITTALRGIDIFGRMGGEEFAVALPDTDLGGAICVAERLRTLAEKMTVPIPGGHLNLTVSIGVAAFDNSLTTLTDLLKASDNALYQAKQGGRNRVVYIGKDVTFSERSIHAEATSVSRTMAKKQDVLHRPSQFKATPNYRKASKKKFLPSASSSSVPATENRLDKSQI